MVKPRLCLYVRVHLQVLAHRGGLWTSLQWTCQVLWDQAIIITQLVERGPSQDQPAPLSLDQLYNVLSPLLVLATDLLLDMMVKLQVHMNPLAQWYNSRDPS